MLPWIQLEILNVNEQMDVDEQDVDKFCCYAYYVRLLGLETRIWNIKGHKCSKKKLKGSN